jgi:hypothetical protein
MGRLATPADVGNVVSLLCASVASLVTGQIIMLDGGASFMNSEVPDGTAARITQGADSVVIDELMAGITGVHCGFCECSSSL